MTPDTKYHRKIYDRRDPFCAGLSVDIYDVLEAYRVTACPALSHLAKKALCPGQRGAKGYLQDLLDVEVSIRAAIDLERQRLRLAAKETES